MKRGTRLLLTLVKILIAIGLLTYLGLSGAIDWRAFRGLIVSWPITLTAFLVLLCAAIVTAWRLCVLLKPRGFNITLLSSVRLTLIGTFFNVCLPGSTGGDLVRIYYATGGNRGQRTEVTTIMLLDRAAGLLALLIWPLLAAPLFPRLLGSTKILQGLLLAAAVTACVMLALMLLGSMNRMKTNGFLLWTFRNLPLGSYAERIFDTVHAYRRNAWTLLAAVGISLLAHSLTICVIMLVALAINPMGFAWRMSVVIPLGFLANALPVTPGGLGVGEAAFNKLFALAGLNGGAESLLGWRFLMILVGMIGLVFYLQGRKRFIHQSFPAQPTMEELSLAGKESL